MLPKHLSKNTIYYNDHDSILRVFLEEILELCKLMVSIALDPGVRTFQTGYSNDEIIEFSSRTDKIVKLQKKVDMFKSLRDKNKRE